MYLSDQPPYFQPHIARMSGYAPGEQPRGGEFIKLNTNENPYPASPRVFEAIRAAADDRLRLYPDPMATALRVAAAELHGLAPEWILAGNGSDDLLTIITRSFAGAGTAVIYPTPTYILYRTLVELQDARPVEVPYEPDWSLDPARFAAEAAATGARLAFLANPNSPSGTMLAPRVVADIARRLECPLVVDEAYVDFADANCAALVSELPNVIVTRTLSKAYGLAGLRVGYLIAPPEIVCGLMKVKDSYNCNRLSIEGGAAALRDQAHARAAWAKVRATRARLARELAALGFRLPPSQANFVWCGAGPSAVATYEALRSRRILVRLMHYAGLPPGLRITVGSEEQCTILLGALAEIVRSEAASGAATGAWETPAS